MTRISSAHRDHQRKNQLNNIIFLALSLSFDLISVELFFKDKENKKQKAKKTLKLERTLAAQEWWGIYTF